MSTLTCDRGGSFFFDKTDLGQAALAGAHRLAAQAHLALGNGERLIEAMEARLDG